MDTPLTISARITCPHGGQVLVSPNKKMARNERGHYLLDASEPFIIVGCPSPICCVKLIWLTNAEYVKQQEIQTVTRQTPNVCLSAQGVSLGPAVIMSEE